MGMHDSFLQNKMAAVSRKIPEVVEVATWPREEARFGLCSPQTPSRIVFRHRGTFTMPTKATESAGGKVSSSVMKKTTSTSAGTEAENAEVNAATFPGPPLLAEYALGWSLHQLAPFLDKMVGVAGAMDHRMIEKPYDWYVRLPLALMCLVMPNSHTLLVAHIVNIVCWFDVMPAVWDYMVWCAILESTFVIAAILSSSSDEVSRLFLPAIRAQLIVLYFSAAFWKLTTSWFDTHYSCATVLMSELLAGLEPLLPPLVHVAEPMLLGAPALVAGIEFAVRPPTPLRLLRLLRRRRMLLLRRRRRRRRRRRPRWGVLIAILMASLIRCRRCCSSLPLMTS